MFEKNEPKDIFEGVDSPSPVSAPTPKAPVMPSAPAEQPMAPPPVVRHGGGALKTIVVLVCALVAVGLAAYLTYAFMVKPSANIVQTGTDTTTEPDGKGETPITETDNQNETGVPTSPLTVDSDGDGLTDTEEAGFGTNPDSADTDGDGLGDREEVQVYGTDPLRSDTDGDGYTDGSEVANGYNPNGDGKLLQIPTTPAGS